MAYSKLIPLVVMLLLIPAFGMACPVQAESTHVYRVKQLEVFVMVQNTGDIMVAERMTFNLTKGNFSMIYRSIPHFGYERMADAIVYNGTNEQVKSGSTYQFDWFRGKYEIRWTFNPIIGPAEVNFTVVYGITNAVAQTSKDQNGVDWYAVGQEWDVLIETLNFTMILPRNYSGSQLLRTDPANVQKVFSDTNTVLFLNKTNIAPKTPVRVIVHFPTTVAPRFSWERMLRENTFLIAALIFAIVFLIFLAVAVTRFAAARLPPKDVRADRRLHTHPAKLATLIAGRYTPYALLAGLASLGKRGGIRLNHEPETDDVRLEPQEMEEGVGSHDALIVSAAKEEGSVRSIGGHWPGFRKELQRHTMIEMKFDGMVAGPGRFGMASIIGGITMLLIALPILIALTYFDAWDAVLYGGILLGVAMAGSSVLVIGGFLTPRRTIRGARERAAQAAYIDGLRARILELAPAKPAEAMQALNQFLPLLIAASPTWRGGFPEVLRQIAAANPEAPFSVTWYTGNSGSSAETLGDFGRDFSHTADEFPHMLQGPGAAAPPQGGPGGMPPEPDSGLYSDKDEIPELQMESMEQGTIPPPVPPPEQHAGPSAHSAPSAYSSIMSDTPAQMPPASRPQATRPPTQRPPASGSPASRPPSSASPASRPPSSKPPSRQGQPPSQGQRTMPYSPDPKQRPAGYRPPGTQPQRPPMTQGGQQAPPRKPQSPSQPRMQPPVRKED